MLNTPENINLTRQKITSYLENRQLYDAISILKQLLDRNPPVMRFRDILEETEQSYRYMMQYMTDGVEDPQRNDLYYKIISSLHDLTDRIINELLMPLAPAMYYSAVRYEKMNNKSLQSIMAEYDAILDKQSLLQEAQGEQNGNEKNRELNAIRERLESAVFKYIWISFPASGEEMEVLKGIFNSTVYPQYFKELLVSALFLGLLEYYQENKLLLLLELYSQENPYISMRALTSALIIFYKYPKRCAISKNLKYRLDILKDNPSFEKDVKTIFLQFIRSRNTERITKKMREELIPELMKLSPEIYKKFKGSDNTFDIEGLEENPDWQDILDKNGITKKMQELNEIQMDGGDVFMGTFAHLKSFPFFNEISNWFLPYHQEHSILDRIFGNDDNHLKNIIADAPYLCSSDKYSFSLSLGSVPEMQKKMMLSQFDEQNMGFKEMKSSELETPDKEKENIANKYVQDLYRFFKLYNRKQEFFDPFSTPLNLLQVPYIESVFTDTDSLRFIGEFYFKYGYYTDAVAFFNKIIEISSPTAELCQKVGFCYQNTGDTDAAIDAYKKAELLNNDDAWTLRHIATCYKIKKSPQQALEYYMRAETIIPDNIPLMLNIGHCLLELDRIEEALKYYFKVDYMSSKGKKSWRPIAWCSFILGNFTQSETYYEKVLNDNPSALDYMNTGHLKLVTGKIKEAINFYKESIIKDNHNINQFIDAFNNDKGYLIKHGLDDEDISIIIDKLKYDS